MKDYYRDPQVEEGISNLILQNRCGNRLTVMLHEGWSELEFVYKPNAFRRHEFAARNFSTRDNFTSLFTAFSFPEIGVETIEEYFYDPFITRLETQSVTRARNTITILNLPRENCFAFAARCPLLITMRPKQTFTISDGLLTEKFTDRGEEIVSFIKFRNFQENRFRQLEDGRVVLQVMANDLLFVGGEENYYQVNRTLKQLENLDLKMLQIQIEAQLSPILSTATISCNDPDMQRVIDLNKRVIYSGLDEGGACFGALNRIYHLIWLRDGAMATTMMARAGLPELLKIWTPFVLANPSRRQTPEGSIVSEFLQLLGTRWTKTEDDGIFYAVLSLFTLYQTLGDRNLLHQSILDPLLEILDYTIRTRFNADFNLFISDTRGETTLTSSPQFGYDSVNGTMNMELISGNYHGREIWMAGTLYHNVNMYNTLCMMALLLADSSQASLAANYRERAASLQQSIKQRFVDSDGHFQAGLLLFEDGTYLWDTFAEGDPWEYTWAISVGPFFPDATVALRSARMVYEQLPKFTQYGYCPWNTLSRMLKEFGLSSTEYREMLAEELRDALQQTVKYPLIGALTEYWREVEGWRALPFSAGSFMFSVAALSLQALPQGLAVRANDLVETIKDFHFRISHIDVYSSGTSDVVSGWQLNGTEIVGTLQVPEQLLRMGPNTIQIACDGENFTGWRLYSSNARLYTVEAHDGMFRYHFTNAIASELYIENFSACSSLRIVDALQNELTMQSEAVEASKLTRVTVNSYGDFTLIASS